jgi:hypothetical protein
MPRDIEAALVELGRSITRQLDRERAANPQRDEQLVALIIERNTPMTIDLKTATDEQIHAESMRRARATMALGVDLAGRPLGKTAEQWEAELLADRAALLGEAGSYADALRYRMTIVCEYHGDFVREVLALSQHVIFEADERFLIAFWDGRQVALVRLDRDGERRYAIAGPVDGSTFVTASSVVSRLGAPRV